MKKKKKILLAVSMFVFMSVAFSTTSFAANDEQRDDFLSSESRDIIEDFADIIPIESGISTEDDSLIESIGFESMMRAILDALRGESSELFSFFLMTVGFAVLCVVCDWVSFSNAETERAAGVGVLVIMSVAIYPRVYSVFETVRESLEATSSFFGAALPIMTAVTTAQGSVKTAGVQAMNMNITLGVVGAIAGKILLPLSFAMLALALVSSFGDGSIGSVGRGIKSIFTFGLGIVTAVSSAAIALQTVIASASDSAALRAARYAAGGLIPVVGSSVSSALSTLAGGLAYAKSTVGAATIAVIAVISIAPLITLIVYRMIFSLAVSFLEYMGNLRGVRCFSAYKTAFDAVISVYVMSTLVCIIQVIIFLKGGGNAS